MPEKPPKAPTLDQAYFTVKEAADVLRLSRGHLYNMLSRGDLHAEYIGRVRRIPHSEILRLLSSNGNGEGEGDGDLAAALLRISDRIAALFPKEAATLHRVASRPGLRLLED